MMLDLPQNKKIILFDGVCNLCESSVQFVIKHDVNDQFRFVSLQSELGQKILEHLHIRGRITISELEALTHFKRSTLKVHLSNLVKSNQIKQNGMGRGFWYSLY